jgi:hypothetical protein
LDTEVVVEGQRGKRFGFNPLRDGLASFLSVREVMFLNRTLFCCEGASAVEASEVSFSAHNFINARQFAAGSNTKFKPHRLSILLSAGFVDAPAPHD